MEKPYLALEVIKVLPLEIIQLCNLFWKKQEVTDDIFAPSYDNHSMESKYGLVNDYTFKYFPASAYQTPIYWLLQSAFRETLDFIINFVNDTAESYRHSDYGREDVKEVTLHINSKEVKQYSCWAFWGMYRGTGTPVVPDLLQSIHMALEKVLLAFSKTSPPDIIQPILLKILEESKSASLTSVVCSVVLASPSKYYNVALVLFRTIELFHVDLFRKRNEFRTESPHPINQGGDIFYTNERFQTSVAKHRNLTLEFLFLDYQFRGVGGFTDEENSAFIEELYGIIDHHKSNISTSTKSKDNSWEILLLRMDRRNLVPNILEEDGNKAVIEFRPKEIPEELKEQSEQDHSWHEEIFKYTYLRVCFKI